MTEKIEGFVLDIIKHSDSHDVVTLFTRSRGRVSFLSSASRGKSGKMRAARLLPLACVSAQVNFRQNRELQFLPAITPVVVWRNIYFNPVKSSLVFFISEFLNGLLRQAPPDEALWNCIMEIVSALDDAPADRLQNFHIATLVRLLGPTGILPPLENYRPGLLFDMQKADFVSFHGYYERDNNTSLPDCGKNNSSILSARESAFLPLLSRISLLNQHRFRFSVEQRDQTLDRLLKFFSLHLPVSPNLKSLEILHALFS